MIRPSYVLGGRAMMIVYDDEEMAEYFALHVGKQKLEHPVLIDKFLENAIEVDVDALSDGEDVYVAGVMEHIEEAGIHSGDSSCVLASLFAARPRPSPKSNARPWPLPRNCASSA